MAGSRLNQQESDFDTRSYGYARLRPLIEAIDLFELDERPDTLGHKHLWLRDKRRKGDNAKAGG